MASRLRVRVAAALFAGLAALATASADEVWLKNGDHLTGKVESMTDGGLVIDTPWAGKVKVTWAEVKGLKTDAPLPFELADKSTLVGTAEPDDQEGLIGVRTEKLKGRIRLGDVAAINPPPPPDKGMKWSGFIRAGAVFTDGNTRTREANAAAQVVGETERVRLTLRGNWNYGENRLSEDRPLFKRNATGELKLDVFLTQRFYLYAAALFQGDTFQDLTLRSAFGGGVGYQWIRLDDFDGLLKLHTEAGLAYVVDDRRRGEDTETLAVRVAWAFEWNVVKERVVFFHNGEAFPSVEDKDDFFLNTSTGVRLTIVGGFFASAQVDFRYDNQPAPGFGRKDFTYILSLGYNF